MLNLFKELWCRKEDLNLRPIAYEATALPTELFRQIAALYPDYRPPEIQGRFDFFTIRDEVRLVLAF